LFIILHQNLRLNLLKLIKNDRKAGVPIACLHICLIKYAALFISVKKVDQALRALKFPTKAFCTGGKKGPHQK